MATSQYSCRQNLMTDESYVLGNPWGPKEPDMTEYAHIHAHTHTHNFPSEIECSRLLISWML